MAQAQMRRRSKERRPTPTQNLIHKSGSARDGASSVGAVRPRIRPRVRSAPLDRPEVPFELSRAMFVLHAATAYTPTAPPFEQAKFWRPALKNDVLPTPSVATAAVALESFFDDEATARALALEPPQRSVGEEVPCATTEDGCVFFTAEYWAQPQPSLAPPQPAAATRPYDDGCWWEDGCDSWGGAS